MSRGMQGRFWHIVLAVFECREVYIKSMVLAGKVDVKNRIISKAWDNY